MVTHLTPTHAALRAAPARLPTPHSSSMHSFAAALLLALIALLTIPAAHAANTAPTPTIVSAVMRPGTNLMDVIYQINDPDDATVRVRALAFVDGTRSFAKVLKPVTFVGNTAANLGDAIPTNTPTLLTWNVAADWNIDLGQVKFEILALDSRGLLPIDWIAIPAASGQPALTISKDTPTDATVLNALFWLYADNDPGLSLTNGILTGNAQSGVFNGVPLADAATVPTYAAPFVLKRMNLDVPTSTEIAYANNTARAGLLNPTNWHALNRPSTGLSILSAWGKNDSGQATVPKGLSDVTAIAAGYQHSLALKSDGTVVAWGSNNSGQATIPAGLSGVTAISAGYIFSLALKADGTVVAWGNNTNGECNVPAGLSGVTAISAGYQHALALKSDGSVVAWGINNYGQCTIPATLSGVTAIAAGWNQSIALKTDKTLTGWGAFTTPPTGLTGVTAVAKGWDHALALKSDGTVVAWGTNSYGQATVPSGLSGVTAIAAGHDHSLALKADGSIVAWGRNTDGQTTTPAGVSGVTKIASSLNAYHSLALKAKAP